MQESQYNWHHVAHIIRDIFPGIDNAVIQYGLDHSLVPILRSPEHGIEAWGVHTKASEPVSEHITNWPIAVNDSYFGNDFCKLFMSFDYEPDLTPKFSEDAAVAMFELMKIDSFVFLVGPANWAENLPVWFRSRWDIAKEIQRYSEFKDRLVKVYEKHV